MTEGLKLIVIELNKLLETDYNLITFDSLSPESLLQVLVDVFQAFGAIDRLDVRENDPEETNALVMEALRKVQYRPTEDIDDPGAFRRGMVRGEKKLIHPILRWMFENRERVKKAAYLAKFLIPLDLPPEAMSMPELGSLWAQYLETMNDFKDAHRAYEQSVHEGTQTRELRNDISAIETEIENVKKRIERTQARLDKVPQQELLLEAANSLRIEKERQKELLQQIDEQKQGLNRGTMVHERLQKDLHNAKMSVQGATPQNLMESIIEETQVLEFMVQQKLPQELHQRRSEVQTLQEVIDEPNITRGDLQELQHRVDEMNREIQRLVEVRLAEYSTQNDTLGPFRQQAAMVARNKEAAAEQLDQMTKELREVERQLQDRQRQLQETVGEVILRGEDLKQFVNTLRAKSNVYKQQRSELAAVKAEVNDLTQTLENLKSQDPSLSTTLSQLTDDEVSSLGPNASLDGGVDGDVGDRRSESPITGRGMTELARLVDGLQRAVGAARERVTPLSQQLRPLRERVIELKDEMDSKKQRGELPRRINRSLKKMAKLNLLTVLNENVTKPITRFFRNDILELQRNKTKAEYHYCSDYRATHDAGKCSKASKHSVKCIEFSCREYSPNKPTLRDQLKEFTMKHNPSEDMVKDLLSIMKDNGLELSSSSNDSTSSSISLSSQSEAGSSFCAPPTYHNFDVIPMSVGRYLSFGIKRSVTNYLQRFVDDSNHWYMKTLFMDVAFYVVKSEKSKQGTGGQLPHYLIILGKLSIQLDEPFVIGVYQGAFPTPTIANEILRPLVDEMKELENRKFEIESRPYLLSIRAVLCDPIANSLITCTALPNSQYGCSKCNQKGQLQFHEGITSFPPTANLATLRTDDDFVYGLINGHHVGVPVLGELNLDLKSQFMIDYKYVVCEGVMKRLMSLWMTGKLDYRLNKQSLRRISGKMVAMAKYCPREFRQKPKPLDELDLWDAYDWRQFLLYYSPIVLKKHMAHKYYVHFLYLHLAMRILISGEIFVECNTFVAGQLLNTFVADFSNLYGSQLIDYNVHNLLHFEEVNMKAGPMCRMNGFHFDRQMDTILRSISTNATITLEELGAQIEDTTSAIVENQLNEYKQPFPRLEATPFGTELLINQHVTLSIREPDNCVITKNGVMLIEAFGVQEGEIIITGRRFVEQAVLYQAPVTTQKLLLVSGLSDVCVIKASDIVSKGTYDALIATLNAESATMQSKITETERAIRKLEQEWQELQLEHERSQLLLEKANEEMSTVGNGERVSLKETLSQQILEQETTLKRLTEEKVLLLASKNDRAQQLEMWTDLRKLFEVKIRCLHERKQRGPGGTLSVSRGGAETFTLQ
uniref:IFT81 calponin homology domain-containing protein n=1 Tax=Anopheles minimus TaxID=112268 RepID=A0A182W2L2_9DIPT